MNNLKDVAAHAGVSCSTVSRVLAGKSCVNEKTKMKVLEAVNALNYHPNALAKGLKMGRTNTIALMIPSIENQIFPSITRGVEDTARKSGFTVILCNTDEDMEVEKEYIDKLKTRWVDGIVVASMLPDSDHIREPSAGPTILARLKMVELREMAFIKSSLPTSSTKNACLAGRSIVCITPNTAARTRISQYRTLPRYTNNASANACTIKTTWVKINILRFGNLSIYTPAKRENSRRGPNWNTPKSPKSSGDFVRLYTSHTWAALCIHVPISEMHCPIQKYLKFL